MCPRAPSSMWGSAAFTVYIAPKTFVRTISSASPSSWSAKGA